MSGFFPTGAEATGAESEPPLALTETVDASDTPAISQASTHALTQAMATTQSQVAALIWFLNEAATATDAVLDGLFPRLREYFAATESATLSNDMALSVVDQFAESDATLFVWSLIVSDTAAESSSVSLTLGYVERLVDLAVAIGVVESRWEGALAVAEAMVLQDMAANGWSLALLETATAAEAVLPSLLRVAALLESMAASQSVVDTLRIVATVDESADLADEALTGLSALQLVSEGATLFAGVTLGSVEYSAFVVNLATKAIVEYQNFPFNSFASWNDRYWGGSDYGLFELVGDTDNGDEIAAWVRTALGNLGTGKAKRAPSMYVGYTSTGTMVLKVITTSSDGAKHEYWYEMAERDASASRENRIKIGRGLKSVYFAFELHNKDGADFAIDNVELLPMLLDRRIT